MCCLAMQDLLSQQELHDYQKHNEGEGVICN